MKIGGNQLLAAPLCLPLLVAIISVCIQLADPITTDLLRFHRQQIIAGQWWRLISGNFCHLGWAHLSMNLLGLILIYLLFHRVLTWKWWITLFVPGSLAVGLLLFYVTPEVQRYVGLSAILHGIIISAAMLDFNQHQVASVVLIVGMFGKVIWEQSPFYHDDISRLIGGNVLVDSHLMGVVTGAATAMLYILVQKTYCKR